MEKESKVSKKQISRTKRNKPVIATDGWGNETRYSSGREAARQLGITRSGVTYVLSGQRKTSGGYRFRYADE